MKNNAEMPEWDKEVSEILDKYANHVANCECVNSSSKPYGEGITVFEATQRLKTLMSHHRQQVLLEILKKLPEKKYHYATSNNAMYQSLEDESWNNAIDAVRKAITEEQTP